MIPRMAVDATLGRLERGIVGRLRLENEYPPLFIVGAPRSGTTLVYQHLFYRFRFACFPNLAKRYPGTCVTAAAVARLGRPRVRYTSRFGITDGVAAPSDGWDVFHRWFPRDDPAAGVDEEHLHELRTIVRLLEALYRGPFLNKNNGNSLRVPHLHRLFPDALFVHVERDLAATVDSLLRARRDHGVADDAWWGTAPPQFHDRAFESEIERAVAQVVGLRWRVSDALAELPVERTWMIRYEEFCRAPGDLETRVQAAYEAAGVRLVRTDRSLPSGFEPGAAQRRDASGFRTRVERMAERLTAERRGHARG